MLSPKFQVTLEFPPESLSLAGDWVEAEELLREELQSGIIVGHVRDRDSVRMFLITAAPELCVAEVMDRLRVIRIAPAGVSSAPLPSDPSGRITPIGRMERLPFDLPVEAAPSHE